MTGRRFFAALAVLALVASCGSDPGADDGVARSSAPPVEVRAGVDRAVATTGDTITFTVEVERDEGYSLTLPELGGEIAGFRITDASQESEGTGNGRIVERNLYRLRADLVGSYILPPVEVTYTDPDGSEGVLSTSEIFVEVASVLPADGEASDIREIKVLEPMDRGLRWPWILGVGAVLLTAVAALIWMWRRRNARPEVPPRPAHEVAFDELARLRRIDFSDLEALRAYYFEISEVLRRYIEARFGLNATDLTTEEIVPRLGELHGVPLEQGTSLRTFLVETDRVKFARHLPDPQEIEAIWEHGLGFVEGTAPRVAEGESEVDREAEALEPVGGVG